MMDIFMNKRNRLKKESQYLSCVDDFLRRLGIRPHTKKDTEEKYWKLIDSAGVNHEEVMSNGDPFSEEANDMFFLNEEIALMTLSKDYERFRKDLKTFSTLQGFPSTPKSIVELGSGAGIGSLWLAKLFPDCQVEAYDFAKNALRIGELWAERLNIRNISFIHASYDDIAKMNPTKNADLVFSLSSVPFEGSYPLHLDTLLLSDLSPDHQTQHSERIQDFALACSNLISPEGTIFISPGTCSEWDLQCLFETLRNKNIYINWSFTLPKGTGEGETFKIDELNLFFNEDEDTFLLNSWEEARAIMLCAQWVGKSISLGVADLETYCTLISSGINLVDIEIKWKDGQREHIWISSKAGMLGYFRVNTQGMRTGMIHSAAIIWDILQRILDMIFNLEKRDDVEINKKYFHPFIERKMELFLSSQESDISND